MEIFQRNGREKPPSTTREDKTKWGKVRPLYKIIIGDPSISKTQKVFHTKSVFDELELVL